MTVALLAVLVIACARAGLRTNSVALSREQTNMVNGVFVMLVFLRHFKQYISCGPYDSIFWSVDTFLDQTIVTTFLLYSGYGMMVSLKNKPDYARSIPKRIFKVWFAFAVAVCLFLIENLFLGEYFGVRRILYAFIGWESVGNSNWYVFAILFLYFATFIGGGCKTANGTLAVMFISCTLYILLMKAKDKGNWYYDTIFCYFAGMVLGAFSEEIMGLLKNPGLYLAVLVCSVVAFWICRTREFLPYIIRLELRNILFAVLVFLVTLKLQIGNPVLDWLGRYTFEIYILQRLPMRALANRDLNEYIYFLVCLVITGILAVVFKIAVSFMLGHLPFQKMATCSEGV